MLSLLTIFLIKKLVDQYGRERADLEKFTSEFEKIQLDMKKKDTNNLKKIKDDSSLFSQFCTKIKYFDDNYDSSSKIKMFTRYSKQNMIKKLNKKQEKLLQETFDLQEKIYNNKEDIDYHKQYETLIDNKTKQYITVIDKAIENIKNNMNIIPTIDFKSE